ncbi:hypothetical protein [Thauera sp. WH-1]|uniref:hypothetical protein n=1 Tax=Thauera sp. WH-1 TaxID=3398230 RepID=UPI0039FDD0D8
MSLARSVHRLDIAAPSAELARRAGLLVEDALRTASLPGDGAELMLVRRLDLPVFGSRVSAQGVALGLESACRALAPIRGRDADDAALAAARAVRFADVLEAHLALSARLLGGQPARAWCWALAVPGYRPDAGTGAGLRSIAVSLARGEAAATALPHWFARIVAWGGAERLLRALDADDATLIAQRCPPTRPAKLVAAGDAPAWQRAQAWARQGLARDDPRRRLLETLAPARAWTPAAEGDGGTSQHAARAPRRHTAPAPGLGRGAPPLQGADAQSPQALAEALRPDRLRTASPPAPADPVAAAGTSGAAAPLAATNAHASPTRSPQPSADPAAGVTPHLSAWRILPPPTDAKPYRALAAIRRASAASRVTPGTPSQRDRAPSATAPGHGRADAGPTTHPMPGVERSHALSPLRGADPLHPAIGGLSAPHAIDAPTRAGGLLFLLPVLDRVGLPAWLQAHPDAGGALPAQVMGELLRRLRMAEDDPAWSLARTVAEPGARALAARWLAACRRHLRVAIGIGPASLCLRPAQLVITPTHADVWLAFDQLDLRIRRGGLDIDPGWLPWFGRVVRFHYGRRPS